MDYMELVENYIRYKTALEYLKKCIDDDCKYYMASDDEIKAAFKMAGIELKEKDPTAAKQ